jgi:murein DD-endopeptidase MepM/ murein hydrolase activator NlpD
LLIIRHGDYLTVYQNVQQINVKVGQVLATNQVIGTAFCNSDNQLATVHFAIWQELNKLNPSDWLINGK